MPGLVPAHRPRRASVSRFHRRFVAVPQGPARARGWAAARLSALGLPIAVCDDVVLVLGELVSNVVTHTDVGTFDVTCTVADVVTVVVEDAAPSWPVLGAPTSDSESGRGMLIVEHLTLAWGATDTGHGKAVWARLARTP